MAFVNLPDEMQDIPVKIVEFGEEFRGTVQFYDRSYGKIGLVLEETKQLRLFFESDVESCEILNIQEDFKNKMTEQQMKDIFGEFKDMKVSVAEPRRNKGDNFHLKRLHQIKMDKLLCGHPPPAVSSDEEIQPDYNKTFNTYFEDAHGQKYYLLPAVEQSGEPRMNNVNNSEVHGGYNEKVIREKMWSSSKQFPVLETPSRLYYIEKYDDLFSQAIAVLSKLDVVGVSIEGTMLGDQGDMSLLSMSSEDTVYMFDMVTLGQEIFKYGIGAILTDDKITKVFHDMRTVHYYLVHRYQLRMSQVYDTMIADQVFCTTQVYGGFIPNMFRSLNMLMRDYFGVCDFHLFYPRYRVTHYQSDAAVWLHRPLSNYLKLGAARNCLYLLPLHDMLKKANLLPFHQSVDVLKNYIKDKDDPEAAAAKADMDELPSDIPRKIAPDWIQDPAPAAHGGYTVDEEFIFQNISNPDPVCIFSKDSMHQTYEKL